MFDHANNGEGDTNNSNNDRHKILLNRAKRNRATRDYNLTSIGANYDSLMTMRMKL
jgi:hypothetical protein